MFTSLFFTGNKKEENHVRFSILIMMVVLSFIALTTSRVLAEARPGEQGAVVEIWNLPRENRQSIFRFLSLSAELKEPAEVKSAEGGGLELTSTQRVGLRMRGVFYPPKSGQYRFWARAFGEVRFSLGTDRSIFSKRELIGSGLESGTYSHFPDQNFRYASLISNPVKMVSGRPQFFELLNVFKGRGRNKVEIYWSGPGFDWEPIPPEMIQPFHGDPNDRDGDSLPDDWEESHGLKRQGNSAGQEANEGEWGDFDGDGLTNHEELRYGTHPGKRDTDGDELPDFDEIHIHHTNPLARDDERTRFDQSVDLKNPGSKGNGFVWRYEENGLIPRTFRGPVKFRFDVKSAGYHEVIFDLAILGGDGPGELVDIEFVVNGSWPLRRQVRFGAHHRGGLHVLTPFLASGRNEMIFTVDNFLSHRRVKIMGVRLGLPGGVDGDRIPDRVAKQLARENSLTNVPRTSFVSPAFLEGRSRQIPTSKQLKMHEGTGDGYWWADLELEEEGKTSFSVSFEQGVATSGEIEWIETNLFEENKIMIRKGDRLKLAGFPPGGRTGAPVHVRGLTFRENEEASLASDDEVMVVKFSEAGVFDITGEHPVAGSGALRVEVVEWKASGLKFGVLQNQVTSLKFDRSLVDPSWSIDAGKGIDQLEGGAVVEFERGTGEFWELPCAIREGGVERLLVRLAPEGPVLGAIPLHIVRISDCHQCPPQRGLVNQGYPDHLPWTQELVATGLPPNWQVVVEAPRYATLRSGRARQPLSADEFVNGLTRFHFVYPKDNLIPIQPVFQVIDERGREVGRK